MRRIGIIGAMDEEIHEYLKYLKKAKEEKWNEFTFFVGKFFTKDVVIVRTGYGKVFSAMVCQKLIDEYSPSAVIFTGVAGALNSELDIGDVVISNNCIQHDMDASELGFSRGTIPFTDYREFTADEKLKKIALKTKMESGKITEGKILSGDQFITRKKLSDYTYLVDELKGDAVEMEGASISHVCTVNEVPFLVVRTISDKADKDAAVDFSKFLPIVARNSFEVVKNVCKNI